MCFRYRSMNCWTSTLCHFRKRRHLSSTSSSSPSSSLHHGGRGRSRKKTSPRYILYLSVYHFVLYFTWEEINVLFPFGFWLIYWFFMGTVLPTVKVGSSVIQKLGSVEPVQTLGWLTAWPYVPWKETWCLFSALSDETIKLAPKRSWPGVNPVMYLVSATETNSQHVSLKLDHGSPSERMKSIMHAKLNPMVCSQELKACVRGKRNIATWCMTFHKWTVHPQLT